MTMDEDEAAFETLFREWQGPVYRWVLRIVRDPGIAEDVTAESFWRAWRARARFDPARGHGPWLRRIATNAALSHLARKRSLAEQPLPIQIPAGTETPRDPVLRAALAHAVYRLSPKLQAVVLLGLVEDQPYAEIADALGVSLAAVKVRMFRAVRQLRRTLADVESH
jgi:RNA polymerase sigma-70 factor (ECF subfamily)